VHQLILDVLRQVVQPHQQSVRAVDVQLHLPEGHVSLHSIVPDCSRSRAPGSRG